MENHHRWFHYTSFPILELIKRPINFHRFFPKPSGLWLSFHDEWLQWCEENHFATFDIDDYYRYEYEINMAKVKVISTLHEFHQFNQMYKNTSSSIDWKGVYAEYSGIVFLNYDNIKRSIYHYEPNTSIEEFISSFHDIAWFLALDISCACIWDTSILKEIDLVRIEDGKKIPLLPDEIWLKIAKYQDRKSCARLSATCKRLHRLLDLEKIFASAKKKELDRKLYAYVSKSQGYSSKLSSMVSLRTLKKSHTM